MEIPYFTNEYSYIKITKWLLSQNESARLTRNYKFACPPNQGTARVKEGPTGQIRWIYFSGLGCLNLSARKFVLGEERESKTYDKYSHTVAVVNDAAKSYTRNYSRPSFPHLHPTSRLYNMKPFRLSCLLPSPFSSLAWNFRVTIQEVTRQCLHYAQCASSQYKHHD